MEEGGLLTDLLFGEDADLSFDIPLPGLSAQGSAHANTGNKRARESSKTSTAQLEAQKRWREKQKNVAEDMEAELQLRAQQFSHLSEQNGQLKKKLHILESVLAVREQHLARLTRIQQQEAQQIQGQNPQPPRALPGTLQPGPLDSTDPSSSCGRSAALASLSTALTQTTSTQAADHTPQQQATPLVPTPAPTIQLPDPPAVGQPLGSLATMPPAALWDARWMKRMKEVTPREWQQLWLEFMRDSSMFCLGAEAHGPGSRANERLTQVVSTYLGILDQITLLNPSTYYESLYVNLETGKKEEPPPTHWAAVTRSVLSTPAQVRECMAALKLFDDVMAGVLQERAVLAQQVSHAVGSSVTSAPTAPVLPPGPSSSTVPSSLGSVPSFSNLAAQPTVSVSQLNVGTVGMGSGWDVAGGVAYGHLQHPAAAGSSQPGVTAAHAVTTTAGAVTRGAAQGPAAGAVPAYIPAEELGRLAAHLAQNVVKEQQAHNLISDFVVTKVLSVVQVAKAVASSYPYVPDVLAILREGVAMAQAGALGPINAP